MDEDRRTRFLVSPLIFITSLLSGAWFDPVTWSDFTCQAEKLLHALSSVNSAFVGTLLLGIAGGGLLIFVAGYIIGTLTTFILHLLFLIWAIPTCIFRLILGVFGNTNGWYLGARYYEAFLREPVLRQILGELAPALTLTTRQLRRQELSIAVAFDHGLLRENYKGVHRWLFRRWNAVSIALTSAVGSLLSLPFGILVFGIRLTRGWECTIALAAFVLLFVGWRAWRDTMRMLEFMATVP